MSQSQSPWVLLKEEPVWVRLTGYLAFAVGLVNCVVFFSTGRLPGLLPLGTVYVGAWPLWFEWHRRRRLD